MEAKNSQEKLLVRAAKLNPFRLFTAEELQFLICRSKHFVTALKKAGAPFPGGVTRPEWIVEWLRVNPRFQTKSP